MRGSDDDEVFEHQDIHLGTEKAAQGIFGCTDDGFAPDVEAGVDQNGAAGLFFEASKESGQPWIALFIDGLQASGEVDMCDGRDH